MKWLPWSSLQGDEEREREMIERRRGRGEYFNILLGKQYNPRRLQKKQPQITTSIYYQENSLSFFSLSSTNLLLTSSNLLILPHFLQIFYSSSSLLLRIPSYLQVFSCIILAFFFSFLFTYPQVCVMCFSYHYFWFVIQICHTRKLSL